MENNTQNEDEEGLMEVKFTGGGGDFWNWKSESVRPKAFRRKARIGSICCLRILSARSGINQEIRRQQRLDVHNIRRSYGNLRLNLH